MNEQDSKAELFDVFLCHNGEDKPAVREIAQWLVKAGIKPWLDEEQIRPGTSWQTALGEQIESIKSAAVFVGGAGIGPWQGQESQSFLNRFVNRKCDVIPVILESVKSKPELPWPLENLHRVDFRTDSFPLQRLIWGITGKKPAELEGVLDAERPATMREPDNTRLVPGRDKKAASGKDISEARLYPPLAERPDSDNTTQLNILRRRVSEYWVEGFLKHSLYNEVLISLDKREKGMAVDAPWKYTVEVSDAINSGPLDDRDISAIYDATGLLLILGEPGAGKTTTLIDLARTLLERAKDDIKERVPVVLNLSSWKKKQPLAEWISNELSEKYRVPRKIARFWLQRGYLLPLLDGLDEVETMVQQDCVIAINEFIEQLKPSGLVVCCRLNEYRWLPKRLKLNGAICIEPLGPEEVGNYLDAGGTILAALRVAIDTDPVIHELAQTPLMLSIMSLAFQGTGSDELITQKGDSAEKRRKQVFGLYVEQMFNRKITTSLSFPKKQILDRLSWLARKMREDSQSVFLLEGLQPSWLDTRAKRAAYGSVVALSLGLIFGLSVGFIFGLHVALSAGLTSGLTSGMGCALVLGLITFVGVGLGCWWDFRLKNGILSGLIGGLSLGLSLILRVGLASGLIYGLIYGLISGLIIGLIGGLGTGSLNHIVLVETISWKWAHFWKRTIPGAIFGLIFGLVYGLGALMGKRLGQWLILAGALCGLGNGLLFGLVSGLIGGFTDRVKVGKASPNQGIKLSRENSLTAFLVTCLTIGLVLGLIFGPLFGFSRATAVLIFGLDVWLFFGLIAGLVVGLNRGGSTVIKHYALRLILWRSGNTPFKFIKFLDYCAKLIFLKKVGGGYIFIHRMLLDYFADLRPEPMKAEKGRTGSVPPQSVL